MTTFRRRPSFKTTDHSDGWKQQPNGLPFGTGTIQIGTGTSQAPSSSGTFSVRDNDSTLTMLDGSELTIGNVAGLGSHSVIVAEAGSVTVFDSVATDTSVRINASGSLNIATDANFLTQSKIEIDGLLNIETGGLLDVGPFVAILGGG